VQRTASSHIERTPENEEPVAYRQRQFHVGAGISAQNSSYGARRTIARLPGERIATCFLQPTLLMVSTPVKILVVVAAFVPRRCFHTLSLLSGYFAFRPNLLYGIVGWFGEPSRDCLPHAREIATYTRCHWKGI
jgi:hypothetical protein